MQEPMHAFPSQHSLSTFAAFAFVSYSSSFLGVQRQQSGKIVEHCLGFAFFFEGICGWLWQRGKILWSVFFSISCAASWVICLGLVFPLWCLFLHGEDPFIDVFQKLLSHDKRPGCTQSQSIVKQPKTSWDDPISWWYQWVVRFKITPTFSHYYIRV